MCLLLSVAAGAWRLPDHSGELKASPVTVIVPAAGTPIRWPGARQLHFARRRADPIGAQDQQSERLRRSLRVRTPGSSRSLSPGRRRVSGAFSAPTLRLTRNAYGDTPGGPHPRGGEAMLRPTPSASVQAAFPGAPDISTSRTRTVGRFLLVGPRLLRRRLPGGSHVCPGTTRSRLSLRRLKAPGFAHKPGSAP